jgi:hypothetical protein
MYAIQAAHPKRLTPKAQRPHSHRERLLHHRVTMKPLLAALLIFLGCTTTTGTTTGAAAQQQARPSEFKNLQVFPKDIPHDDLIAAMRGFTRSLGVRCDACHVVTATEPKQVLDFPSDAKDEKRVARVMIQMTQQLNGAWMDRVEQAEGPRTNASAQPTAAPPEENEPRVSCWTCHRG